MTNLFKDFHKLCDSESQPQAQVFVLSFENAALKEQVAQREIEYNGCSAMLNNAERAVETLEETIAQQADQIAGLIATNATLDAEWKKTTADKFAELAEVIRLKDAALAELKDLMEDVYAGNYHPDSFTTQPAITALAIQPSPEIIQARDEKVAEACAKVAAPKVGIRYDDYNLTIRNGTVKALRSGEWRKYL